jgi:hypothetical protein
MTAPNGAPQISRRPLARTSQRNGPSAASTYEIEPWRRAGGEVGLVMLGARSLAASLVVLVSACSGPAEGPSVLGHSSANVELSGAGQVFVLATALNAQSGADARSREAASLATGSLLARLTSGGAPLFDADGRRVGASCGVTFVSPSFAVTANHCVEDTDPELPVEAYRPTLALNQGFTKASILSGTFPEYEHARLGPEHGYHTDRFACRLFARCSFDSPGPCSQRNPDVALLECDGRPGDRYGFLDVATVDRLDAEPFMPWKHEVYDLDQSPAADLFSRYSRLPLDYADNYHYLALGLDGREQHQLLPLLSARFAVDVPHQKIALGEHVLTDLLGCHGTSGSGALQRSALGPWQLLGPATFGDVELNSFLCNHQPSRVSRHGPGFSGISYASLEQTRALLATAADRFRDDCSAWPRGETTLFTHLACPRESLAAEPENRELARSLVPPREPAPLDVLGRWPIALDTRRALSMLGPELEQGRSYRVGLDVTVTQGCAAGVCPRVAVFLDNAELARVGDFVRDGQRVALRATVSAPATGRATLRFEVQGGSALLDAASVVPVEHVLDFDRASQRWQAVLLDPRDPDAAPALPRFVGDGAEGFEVQLLPAERLLLPFLALSFDAGVAGSFSVRGASRLRCGLLDASLTPVLVADCSSGALRLPVAAGVSGPATALFIENLGSDEVLLDRLSVVSPAGAAPTGEAGADPDAGAPPALDAGDAAASAAAAEGSAPDAGVAASGRASQFTQ